MKSFTVYEEYYELLTLLDKRESEELSWAIFEYMFSNIKPNLKERQMKIFNNLVRPLNKSKNKSKNASKQNQIENKNKSNEEQIENIEETKLNQNEIKSKTHQDVNVNVYVNKKEKGVIGEKEKEVLDFIEQQEILLTTNDYDRLEVFFDKVSIDDIKDALLSGKGKPFNYTMTILRSRAKEEKKNKNKSVPNWLDKKIESKPMKEEKRKELESFFNEFK